MSKRTCVFLFAVMVLGIALIGCGGGGGGRVEDNQPPPSDKSRTITGRVVSSSSNQGIANVVVRFSALSLSGKSGSDGKFSIKVPLNVGLPVHMTIDTSLVAGVYPSGNTVMYNQQYYDSTMVDIPIDVLNEQANELGNITLYDYSGDSAPPPPYASKNNVLVGRVVSGATGQGVAGAAVRLGTSPYPIYPATTGKAGYYAIDLGLDKSVLSIYPDANVKFNVALGQAASQFPATAVVHYGNTNYAPGSPMPATAPVIAGETNDMGVIKILNSGNTGGGDDGGDLPPPPPPPGS